MTTLMPITETNYSGLRYLVHEHERVVAFFTVAGCGLCQQLKNELEQLASDSTYAKILFVGLAAEEHPVAKQLLQEQTAAFLTSYHKGQLVQCDILFTETQVHHFVRAFHDYAPQKPT